MAAKRIGVHRDTLKKALEETGHANVFKRGSRDFYINRGILNDLRSGKSTIRETAMMIDCSPAMLSARLSPILKEQRRRELSRIRTAKSRERRKLREQYIRDMYAENGLDVGADE